MELKDLTPEQYEKALTPAEDRELAEDELETIAGGAGQQSGSPCQKCGSTRTTKYKALLGNYYIECGACGYKLVLW